MGSFKEVFGLCYMFILLQEGVWSVNKHTSDGIEDLNVLDGKNHTGAFKIPEELKNLFAQDVKNQSTEPADNINSSLQKPSKLNISSSDTGTNALNNMNITDGPITEGGGPIKLRNDNSKDVDFKEHISELSGDKHIKTNPLNLLNDSFSNSDHDKGNLSIVDHTSSAHPKIIPRKGVQEPIQENKPVVSREGVETSKLQNDNSHSDVFADKLKTNQLNSFNDSFPNTDHSKKSPSVVPRKGVDYTSTKIVPRKGVELNAEEINSSISQESAEKKATFLNKECNCCTNTSSNIVFRNESGYNCTCCKAVLSNEHYLHTDNNVNNINQLMNHSLYDLSKGEKVKKQENRPIGLHRNTSVVADAKSQSNSTNGTVSIRKNKKPQFTLDTVNDLPSNSSAKQMSSNKKDSNRPDYVVPVVGIILVIPLVIVLIVFLYKRGSEFWERRHYRRMDFLIDGMYND